MSLASTKNMPAFAFTILVLALAGLDVWFIHNGTLDVVYADTWGYMRLVGDFLDRRLSVGEFFEAHNQNRTPVLDLLLLGSAALDRFNQRHLDYVSVLLAVANTVLIVKLLPHEASKSAKAIVALAIAFLGLSLGQQENLLLSINVTFYLVVTFSILSIIALNRSLAAATGGERYRQLALAVGLSGLALLSMGGGAVLWIVNMIQIALTVRHGARKAVPVLLVYGATGATFLLVYGLGLHQQNPALFLLAERPLSFFKFLLIESGRTVVGFFDNQPAIGLSMGVGAFVYLCCAAALVSYVRRPVAEKREMAVGFSLLMLGLGEQVLIASGRLSFGVEYAAASRYTTLNMMAVVGALLLLSYRSARSKPHALLTAMLAVAVCGFTAVADYNEISMAAARRDYALGLQNILRRGAIGPDELVTLQWPNADDVTNGNATLRRHRLSFYGREPAE